MTEIIKNIFEESREKTDEQQRLNFIEWLRAFAVICILLCHYVQENTNTYIQMTSQIFNIGVNIFFLISGICLGIQGEIINHKKWYQKRIKRIFISYWLFLLVLLIVYLIMGKKIAIVKWILYAGGLQGKQVGILGADHTWFITAILLCYIITPFISHRNVNKYVGCILLAMPVFLALMPHASFSFMGAHVCFYIIAYYFGARYKTDMISKKNAVISIPVLIASFAVRFAARNLIDGTVVYERMIVIYTQYISAIAILIFFSYVFKNIKAGKVVQCLDKISFEVYLYHYMFVVGPISLMRLTSNFYFNTLVVTMVTLAVAMLMNKIGEKIKIAGSFRFTEQ